MAEHSSCQFAAVNIMFCRDQQPQCPCFRLDIGGSKLPDRWLNKDRQQDNGGGLGRMFCSWRGLLNTRNEGDCSKCSPL